MCKVHGLVLVVWMFLGGGAAQAQSVVVSGNCRVNIFLSADLPGLVDDQACAELLTQDPAGTIDRDAIAGNARIGGRASIAARGAFGNLGSGVAWAADAVAGAQAASFSAGGRITTRATDWLNVGGIVGAGPVPLAVTMVVNWDSGLSGNDTRNRNAWLLDADLSLSFAAGSDPTGTPAAPLELGFCGATDNLFAVSGPGLALECNRRNYGPGQVVLSGTLLALPQSTYALVYSLTAQGSFGGLLGSIGAGDGALSSGGRLSAMNSLHVYVEPLDRSVAIGFASGASYLAPAPVPEPGTAGLVLGGIALLALRLRAARRAG